MTIFWLEAFHWGTWIEWKAYYLAQGKGKATGTAQKHYQQKDELTACNFPYGTLFGWHPQVAGTSVENNIESLAWGSKVYGSVILSIKIILKWRNYAFSVSKNFQEQARPKKTFGMAHFELFQIGRAKGSWKWQKC